MRIVVGDQDLLHRAESSARTVRVDTSPAICTKSPQALHRMCTADGHAPADRHEEPSMTDSASAAPAPAPANSGWFRPLFEFLTSKSLVARAIVLASLTLGLKIPLGLVGGVITDRQNFEREAISNVTESWGSAQTFAGPVIVVPYQRSVDGKYVTQFLTLLPERLVIDGDVRPEQRRRGLFSVTVYTATVDVVAEFQTKAVRDLLADGRWIDWPSAHLDLGLSDARSIDGASVEVEGQRIDWTAGTGTPLSALEAPLGSTGLADRETITVRFRLAFGGSGSLNFLPLGRRTETAIASTWPSPSFHGRYLPATQAVDKDGFRAKWSTSQLSRRYGQLWDSATNSEPAAKIVMESAFGFALIDPVDAYRGTDRAIKYAVLFIALTFATCLLFEMATGTRPRVMQYGLIGLSLCIFYLLLLSLGEQIGFAAAYLVSAAAIVVQASVYTWALQRRRGPALAFGASLAGLYAGLYGLLQLEDVALLAGSLLLFAVLSLAMWFTRNLHRPRPA
jgi:inner membrane protein